MEGRWYTTGAGPGAAPVLVILALVLLGGSGAAAVASAIVTVVIIAGAVLGLAVVALAALVAYRIRGEHRQAPPVLLRQLPPVTNSPLVTGPERPAIPQHLHLHFDGADPAAVAEILRRHREQPE